MTYTKKTYIYTLKQIVQMGDIHHVLHVLSQKSVLNEAENTLLAIISHHIIGCFQKRK